MKLKSLMRARSLMLAALLIPALFASNAWAQEEGAPRVVDEVVAQVNTEVITLSMLKKEMAEAADAIRSQRNLTGQQATDEIAKRQAEIIATLVNEQLLLQKGKELGMAEDVEAEVNKRMLSVARDQNLKTIADLERALRENNMDPATIRQTLRAEIMKTWVLGREVDQKVFYSLSDAEVKNYYEANKEKFRKPESVGLSEIYLSTVGKDPKEVRDRADKLVAQLRAGGDFGALAVANSEREVNGKRVATETKGKLGTYAMNEVTRAEVANALKATKVGGVTDPLVADQGLLILRVDERTPAGEPVFDDNHVRETITYSRLDKERKLYIDNLRRESYVEIAPSYRESVMPLLKAEAEKATTPAAPAAKKDDKKKAETSKKQ